MPPILIAGVLAGAGTLGGALISSSASKNAAQTAATANNQATQLQQQIFNTTQQNLSPYIGAGNTGTNALLQALGLGGSANVNGMTIPIGGNAPLNPVSGSEWINNAGGNPTLEAWDQSSGRWGIPNADQVRARLGGMSAADISNPLNSALLKPFSMTEGALQQTPGYQFNLSQGLKSVQNAAAARGLGISGAALKGAASYATGLADNTFQTQMNNYYTGQQNQFQRLMGLSGLGENAAAGQGNIGAQTGQSIGNTTVGAGNALAAGQVGSANAISGGISNLSSLYLMNNLYGGALFGGGGGGGGMYGSGGQGYGIPDAYQGLV